MKKPCKAMVRAPARLTEQTPVPFPVLLRFKNGENLSTIAKLEPISLTLHAVRSPQGLCEQACLLIALGA